MQAMLDLDGSILLWIQAHVRVEALNPVVTFVTHLGDSGWFWIVVALALFAFRRTRRVGLACMIAMLFGLLATDLFLKNWVARVRPYEVVEGLERIIGEPKAFSFPSGHTTNGIACAWVIFRRAPKRCGAPALAEYIKAQYAPGGLRAFDAEFMARVYEHPFEILGASSDHTILDIQDLVDAGGDLNVGDIIEFDLKYSTMVYLTNSDNIEKVYV